MIGGGGYKAFTRNSYKTPISRELVSYNVFIFIENVFMQGKTVKTELCYHAPLY